MERGRTICENGFQRNVVVITPQEFVMENLRAAMERSAKDMKITVSIDEIPFHLDPEDRSSLLVAGRSKVRLLSDSNLLLTCDPSEEAVAFIVALVREHPAMHAVLADPPEKSLSFMNAITPIQDLAGKQEPFHRVVGVSSKEHTHEQLCLLFRQILLPFSSRAA